MKCKICGKEFKNCGAITTHIIGTHGISSKEYYDKFLKKDEGTCRYCGKKTKFYNIRLGYNNVCSNKECIKRKRQLTNIKRYGGVSPFSSKEIQKKIIKTNQYKYGVSYPAQSDKIKEKMRLKIVSNGGYTLQRPHTRKLIEKAVKEKYGNKYYLKTSKGQKLFKKTCLENHGVENPQQSKIVRKKLIKTNIENYGVENPQQNSKIRNKTVRTNIERYGFKCALSDREKMKKSYYKKYGVDNPFRSDEIKKKIKATNNERYGCDYAPSNPAIHKKIFSKRKKDNHGYLSNSEYLFSKRLKNTFYFKSEYFINGHHFDFAIFESGKLKVLVEIDGSYFHGICCDCDGKHSIGEKDYLRFSLVPKGVKFLVIDSTRLKEGFKELRRIYKMTYKEWIKDMIHSIPKEIPYYHFSKERMRKDWEHLCTYKYHRNANLGKSIILNFCKSRYDLDWKEVRKELYYSPVSSHNPLEGLIKTRNISELREKYRKKYKGKKEVLFRKHKPEKMIALCSLNKTYCCTELDSESKKIVKLLNLKVKEVG